MATSAQWGVLLIGAVAANLPFFSERVLFVGPSRAPRKAFGWRLLELLLLAASTVALGMLIEGRIGQRHPQGWQFYVVVMCLFITFAFPGFVWRYLRRGAPA